MIIGAVSGIFGTFGSVGTSFIGGFAGRNIGQVVAQTAINYNNAYSAFIMASLDCDIATLVS